MSDREYDDLAPDELTFDAAGNIVAVIQDHKSLDVLMVAYMNLESIQKSFETGYTWFWSRSRQRLWQKGEESGNTQKIKSITYDCDADALLIKVEQGGAGIACHTGARTCFYRELQP